MGDASRTRRVLVVDDAALVRRYVRSALEPAGFEVDEAINGIDAMEKVLASPFDLLVVDINMPKMDGLQLLASLKASPQWHSIPVVMITTGSPRSTTLATSSTADEMARATVASPAIAIRLPSLTRRSFKWRRNTSR